MLKLTTVKHEASRGLSATAELLVFTHDLIHSLLPEWCHCPSPYAFLDITK